MTVLPPENVAHSHRQAMCFREKVQEMAWPTAPSGTFSPLDVSSLEGILAKKKVDNFPKDDKFMNNLAHG